MAITLRKFVRLRNPMLLWLSVFIVVSIIYRLVGYSSADMGNYSHTILMLISIWMGMYMWKYESNRNRKVVFWVFIITFLVNIFYSIQIRVMFPEFADALRQSEEMMSQYGKLNIGSTEYTYCAMFMAVFAFIYLFRIEYKERIMPKSLFLVIFVFLFYFIVVYGLSATALLSLLCSILGLMFFIKGKEGLSLLFIVFLLVIFPILSLYSREIISFVTEVAGEKIGSRIAAIFNVSSNRGKDDEGLFSRIPMLWYDIKYWFSDIQSFLFGWGYHTYGSAWDGVQDLLARNKNGGHSAIMDVLPKYGLFGLTFLYFFISSYWKYIKRTFGSVSKEIGVVIFILVIFNNIVNKTLQPNVIFILSFIYPLLTFNVKHGGEDFVLRKKNSEIDR